MSTASVGAPALGVSIRQARAADYETYCALLPELGSNDEGPSRDRFLAELVASTWMAEMAGHVVGFATVQTLSKTGYVRQLVVAKAARRQGVGRALMMTVKQHFQAAGVARWCLNVVPDNRNAVALYKSLGLEQQYLSVALRLTWAQIALLPEAATPTTCHEVLAGEDEELELAFNVPSGVLAHARTLPNRRLLRLDLASTPGQAVGLAVFDPAFPGAFPFSVVVGEFVRPLLDAMRTYAMLDIPYVQVVLEDDEALARLLLKAGAELRLRFAHFAAAL